MKGLIIKDLNYLKRTSILTLLVPLLILYVILGLVVEHDFNGFSGLIIFVCSMFSITTFAYDAQDGFNKTLFTLPITKSNIVLSKYITTLIITIFGLLLGLIYSFIMSLLRKYIITADEIIYNLIVFEAAIVAISFIIPVIYKMGVEKARILIVSFVALPFISEFIIEKLGIQITKSTLDILIKISPIMCIALIIISYFISLNIYKKKDINDLKRNKNECFSKNFN